MSTTATMIRTVAYRDSRPAGRWRQHPGYLFSPRGEVFGLEPGERPELLYEEDDHRAISAADRSYLHYASFAIGHSVRYLRLSGLDEDLVPRKALSERRGGALHLVTRGHLSLAEIGSGPIVASHEGDSWRSTKDELFPYLLLASRSTDLDCLLEPLRALGDEAFWPWQLTADRAPRARLSALAVARMA